MAKKSDFTVGISALKEELDKLTVAIRETQEEYNKTTEGLTKKEKKKYDELRLDIKLMTDDLEKAKEKIKSFEEVYNSLEDKKSKDSRDKIKSMVVEMGALTTSLKQQNTLAEMHKNILNGTLEVVKEINENTNKNNNNNPSNGSTNAPNPSDWANWDREIANALDTINKIRETTRGLSEGQKEELGKLAEGTRTLNKETKERYASERMLSQIDWDNISAQREKANAIKVAADEYRKLTDACDKARVKLTEYVAKNKETSLND